MGGGTAVVQLVGVFMRALGKAPLLMFAGGESAAEYVRSGDEDMVPPKAKIGAVDELRRIEMGVSWYEGRWLGIDQKTKNLDVVKALEGTGYLDGSGKDAVKFSASQALRVMATDGAEAFEKAQVAAGGGIKLDDGAVEKAKEILEARGIEDAEGALSAGLAFKAEKLSEFWNEQIALAGEPGNAALPDSSGEHKIRKEGPAMAPGGP